MKAMILNQNEPIINKPLIHADIPIPEPETRQIRIKISSCGICHTDLDVIEGRLKSKLPVVPGHQIVGKVDKLGSGAKKFQPGTRVGVA